MSAIKGIAVLSGERKAAARELIEKNHYTHSVPSGKSYYLAYEDAIVVWSIPANKNLAKFILGYPGKVWELSRLWAPDGHRPTLLTEAISLAARQLRHLEPGVEVLVSYADPNAGHHGGVYRAASWVWHGQSEEVRVYIKDGQSVARRAFHSGSKSLRKAEIEALGYAEHKLPGKLRFVKPLSRSAKRKILP